MTVRFILPGAPDIPPVEMAQVPRKGDIVSIPGVIQADVDFVVWNLASSRRNHSDEVEIHLDDVGYGVPPR